MMMSSTATPPSLCASKRARSSRLRCSASRRARRGGENHLRPLRARPSSCTARTDAAARHPREAAPAAGSFSAPTHGELATEMRSVTISAALAVRAPRRSASTSTCRAARSSASGRRRWRANSHAMRQGGRHGGRHRERGLPHARPTAGRIRWSRRSICSQVVRVDFRVEAMAAPVASAGHAGIFAARRTAVARSPAEERRRGLTTRSAPIAQPFNARTRCARRDRGDRAEGTVLRTRRLRRTDRFRRLGAHLAWPMTHQAKTDAARVPAGAVLLSESYKEAASRPRASSPTASVSTNARRERLPRSRRWIERHKSERFFVYVQTIDPHVPYDPPSDT